MVKPSKSQKTLEQVSADLYRLIQQFQDNQEVQSMHSFKLLQRVLDEQCIVSTSNDGVEIAVKAPKQIPSDSLQNPSDPDAGYSGHKGQGYQVQVIKVLEEMDTVPLVWANKNVGHMGDIVADNGGDWARITIAWIKYQFFGDPESAALFEGEDCGLCIDDDPESKEWTVQKYNGAP